MATRLNLSDTSSTGIEKRAMVIKDCIYCSRFSWEKWCINECYELYHQPCLRPACSPSDTISSPLCHRCRHLRLWHRASCLSPAQQKVFIMPFWLRETLQVEVPGANRCQLCQVIDALILSAFDIANLSEHERLHTALYVSRETRGGREHLSASVNSSYSGHGTHSSVNLIGSLEIIDGTCSTVASRLGKWVSWSRLRDAYQSCLHEQYPYPKVLLKNLPIEFRVIDVARRCILSCDDCAYVCLSYVWGPNADRFVGAYKRNIKALSEEFSLDRADLPATIKDAMKACEQLQERYSWVDRLCIVQDDLNDKNRQINAMGQIFSSARLVIIAAHGDGVESGLPGVGYARPALQRTATLPSLTITNTVHERLAEPLAIWHRRGWTYQEAIFAQRKLYFTKARAYLVCDISFHHEDEFNNQTAIADVESLNDKHHLILGSEPSAFDAYMRHVMAYMLRALTFRTDTYKAFSGIFLSLFGADSEYYGLPLAHFDRALLWYPLRSEDKLQAREYQSLCFPSWSWASRISGSADQVVYDYKHRVHFFGALTAWYKYDNYAGTSLLSRIDVTDTGVDGRWAMYMTIAWREGCFDAEKQVSLERHSWSELRKLFHIHWPDYTAFHRQLTSSVADTNTVALMRSTPGAICARTQCVSFGLGVNKDPNRKGTKLT